MKTSLSVVAACTATALIPAVSYAAKTQTEETITIISSRIAQPKDTVATSIQIIDETLIDALGQFSVADTLRAATGVNVSNSGGLGKNTTLRIRGEEGFRTKLFIDGVSLADPSAPQVSPLFDDVLSAQVERIEVLRGPQGLAYGADAGGVISVTTHPISEGLSGNVGAQFGRFDTRLFNASLSAGTETAGIFLAVTDIQTDGFNAQSADISGETDGYENTSLHLKGTVTLSDSLSAQLVVRDMQAENAFDGCFSSVTFTTVHDCTSETDNTTARLSLNYQGETMQHRFGIADTRVDRDNFSEGIFAFGNAGSIKAADYIGSVRQDAIQWVFGADIEQEELDETGESRYRRGGFVEAQWSPEERLSSSFAVRYDNHDAFGSQTSVRLGAGYLVYRQGGTDVRLKGTYGTGFRAPSLFEQAYNDGPFAFGNAAGLQLREEHSEGFDAGVTVQTDTGLDVEIVWFNQTIEDEIQFDNAGFSGYLQFEGESESQGIEMSILQPLGQMVSLWGNYTYNDTETNTGENRLRRPRHLANLGVIGSYFDQSLTLSMHARLVKDAIDIAGIALDDYTVLNLSVQYQVTESLAVNGRLDNATDRDYQEVGGFNTAGRNAYVGVSYQF